MKRKNFISISILTFVLFLSSLSFSDGRVLLMVPHEDQLIKVGLDLSERHPSLLISYKLGADNTASLKGWTGTEWVYVSVDNFQRGKFFREGPDEAIIIESDHLFPEGLVPSESWCDAVYKITSTDICSVVHLVGQSFHFKYDDWKWFAKRYNKSLSELNPTESGMRWYNRRLGDVFKGKRISNHEHLSLWKTIRDPRGMKKDSLIFEKGSSPIVIWEYSKEKEESEISEVDLVDDTFNPLEEEQPLAEIISPDSDI